MSVAQPFYFIVLHLFVFVLSVVTALLEIQIEGGNGWAKKLPTWRLTRLYFQRLFNRVELTGYHVYLGIFILLMFHFPLLLTGWSWMLEWTILSCYFAYNILWDFLWFVLNPSYGWCRYSKMHIWWFRRWLGPFPDDYYITLIFSAICAMLRGYTMQTEPSALLGSLPLPLQQLLGWSIGLCVSIACTSILIRMRGCRISDMQPEGMLLPSMEKA